MDYAVSFSIAGKGYFAGGNQAVGISKALWQYDPSSDTWNKKADFPYETYGSVGFSLNNKGYIGLGHAGSEFWQYDPEKDAWSKTVNFIPGFRTGAKAIVIDNKAYVGLGSPSWTVYPKDMWEFSAN
jgi:N-acetylneuraminic acid mutarotase